MQIPPERLPELIQERRWAGLGTRRVTAARVLDAAVVNDGPPATVFALVTATLDDGSDVLYHLPLLVDEGGGVRDALDDPATLGVLGELMAHAHAVKGEHGVFEFSGGGLDPSDPPGAGVRVLGAEQSNSSVVLDETYVVKLYRRLQPGPNPDVELTRLLTTEGFLQVPQQVGEASYRTEENGDEIVYDIALAQALVQDAQDGWAWALTAVRDVLDQVHEQDAGEDIADLVEQRAASSLATIAEMGEVIAEMHITLAREHHDPDVTPEPITREDLTEWVEAGLDRLRTASRTDEGDLLPRGTLEELIESVGAEEPSGYKLRIHGDLHLAQMLVTSRGTMVTDFEGEPARPLDARRRKASPLRDVAGMLRSFSYASLTVLLERAEPNTPEFTSGSAWTRAWETAARDRFLQAYLSRSHEGGFLPSDPDHVQRLIRAFELDKALYELGYEQAYRPGWTRIPLLGIERIAEARDA